MQIVLVDDHSLFAEGLKSLLLSLDSQPQVVVYGGCEAAQSHVDPLSVDLVLLDYYLGGVSRLDGLASVSGFFVNARVVVVSAEDDPKIIRAIIDAGAAGFIPKSASYSVLAAALDLVAAGGTYLPAAALFEASRTVADSRPATDKESVGLDCLSKRQQEVLLEVVQGRPNKVIAEKLNISEHTVKAHISASFKLLGVKNRTEAVYVAAKLQQASAVGDFRE